MTFVDVNFYEAGGCNSIGFPGFRLPAKSTCRGLIAGAPERVPEVRIRRGPVPQSLPETNASGPTWQIAGKQFLPRIPDIARFLLNDGSEIVFAPESDATAADIPIFLLGTVFSKQAGQGDRSPKV
jgi:hypothetical protein